MTLSCCCGATVMSCAARWPMPAPGSPASRPSSPTAPAPMPAPAAPLALRRRLLTEGGGLGAAGGSAGAEFLRSPRASHVILRRGRRGGLRNSWHRCMSQHTPGRSPRYCETRAVCAPTAAHATLGALAAHPRRRRADDLSVPAPGGRVRRDRVCAGLAAHPRRAPHDAERTTPRVAPKLASRGHRLRRRRPARRARGQRARGAPGAARAARRRGRVARRPAGRQPRRAAAVRRRRARDGRPAALLDARGRRAGRRWRPSSSWPCAARRGCPCPTSTPSCARTPTSRRPDRARVPGGGDRRGAAAHGRARDRARDGPDGRGAAHGGPRAGARARPQRGRADAPLRRPRRRLHADDRPDARVHGPPAPAPVRAHRGHQRRRAPGGRAARRARRRRCASPTSSASRAWASRSRRTSSAASPIAWSSSPPSACAATCAWSRRSATPPCSWAPTPTRMLELALDLVDAADAEGDDFPQLRVGMAAGPALSRGGRLVRAPGQPGQPRHRHRAAGQRAGHPRGARRGERRLPLVVGRRALAEGRRGAGAPVPRAAPARDDEDAQAA